MVTMDAKALGRFLEENFPQALRIGAEITAADDDGVVLTLPTDDRHLRPGGTIAGPVLMQLADAGTYLAILSRLGPVRAVTSDLTIHFLARPVPGVLHARCRLIRVGRRSAVGTVTVECAGVEGPVAHATVAYALLDGA